MPVLESKHVRGASLESSIIINDGTEEHLKRLLSICPRWDRVVEGWSWDTPSTGLWRTCKHLESNHQPADCSVGVSDLYKNDQQGASQYDSWPEQTHLLSSQISHSPVLSGTALQRRYPILHTISPHSGGCAGAATQYVAIIGPAVGAESQAINPFLLLFAPRLAVTGCRVIGQECACPLRFTLISLQLQTPILDNLPPTSPQSGPSSPTSTCQLASTASITMLG